jgi:hypothetical protein
MRRSVRRQPVGVSLFPFLAVLICTMGSLIVLLVLLVQQARLDASSLAGAPAGSAAPDVASSEQIQQQLEEAQWRREMLEQSRGEKTQELAASRAKLAHLEDHIQRLSARARELMQRATAIDQGQQLQDDQLAAAQADLAKLQAEIARKQTELDAARKKLKDQEQWFALIPYQGPHGTRRRPIYIECTSQGVILQPEGLAFTTDDFSGPLGPHNPLDSALRTVREYWNTTAREAGAPYPLLVVRPDGIVAYGAARAALKDWDEEFGYELVGDDKKLVYGSPDPTLSSLLQKSVAVARRRQIAMAAMMPRRYQDDQPLESFAPEAIGAGHAGMNTLGATGRGAGSGTAAGGMSLAGGGGTGPGSAASGGAARSGQPGTGFSGTGGLGPGGGHDNTLRGTGGDQFAAGGGAAGPYGSAGSGGQSGGAQGGPGGAAGGQPGNPTGQFAATGGQAGSSGNSSAAAGAAGGASSGSASASAAGNGPAGTSSSSSDDQGMSGPSANFQFGSPPPPKGSAKNSAASATIARGRDWALPGANRHATAITRPIHVAVLADRLVLIPERGTDRQALQLRVSDRLTVQEIDAFVAAVQREMKSWGLAVQNGYWKPILQVEVAPDSEHHFADLNASLANSGFEIQRKQP